MKWMTILLLASLLWGCGQQEPGAASAPLPSTDLGIIGGRDGQSIRRFHDADKGVTCWVSQGFNKGGISCLPDSQLKGSEQP
jgi:hypothetical protein